MRLAGNAPAGFVFDLTPFTLLSPDQGQSVETDIEVGLGATPWIGDMRTAAMVAATDTD